MAKAFAALWSLARKQTGFTTLGVDPCVICAGGDRNFQRSQPVNDTPVVDPARSLEIPRIRTAERDLRMWAQVQD